MSSSISTRLYKNLKTLLPPLQTEQNVKIYQDNAPIFAKGPYVVFRIEDMIDTYPTYNATLKFMIWDERNVSSKRILEIADVLESKFNHAQILFTDMGLHSQLTLQQNIPSEHLTNKQCIEQQFDIRLYE